MWRIQNLPNKRTCNIFYKNKTARNVKPDSQNFACFGSCLPEGKFNLFNLTREIEGKFPRSKKKNKHCINVYHVTKSVA